MRSLFLSCCLVILTFSMQSCLYQKPGELDFVPRKPSDSIQMKKNKFSEQSEPIESKKNFKLET